MKDLETNSFVVLQCCNYERRPGKQVDVIVVDLKLKFSEQKGNLKSRGLVSNGVSTHTRVRNSWVGTRVVLDSPCPPTRVSSGSPGHCESTPPHHHGPPGPSQVEESETF